MATVTAAEIAELLAQAHVEDYLADDRPATVDPVKAADAYRHLLAEIGDTPIPSTAIPFMWAVGHHLGVEFGATPTPTPRARKRHGNRWTTP